MNTATTALPSTDTLRLREALGTYIVSPSHPGQQRVDVAGPGVPAPRSGEPIATDALHASLAHTMSSAPDMVVLRGVEADDVRLQQLAARAIAAAEQVAGADDELRLFRAATPIASILHTALDHLRDRSFGRLGRIDLQVEDHLPNVFVDQARIQRLLVHFLNNPIQSLLPDASTTLRVTRQRSSVRIEVRDNGRGSLGISQASRLQGASLGICRRIAGQHFSPLWIARQDRSGMQAWLELPIARPTQIIEQYLRFRDASIARLRSAAIPAFAAHRDEPIAIQHIATDIPARSTTLQLAELQFRGDVASAILAIQVVQRSMDLLIPTAADRAFAIFDVESNLDAQLRLERAQATIARQALALGQPQTMEVVAMESFSLRSLRGRQRLIDRIGGDPESIAAIVPPAIDQDDRSMLPSDEAISIQPRRVCAQRRLDEEVRWLAARTRRRQSMIGIQQQRLQPPLLP
jgi:hypothetical protein